VVAQLQAVEPYPTHAVVRVPWNDAVMLKRVLDIGAQSVLVPMVNTAEEARAAVAAMRYPPKGIRGVGGTTRATRWGRVKGYPQKAEQELWWYTVVDHRSTTCWLASTLSLRSLMVFA
jgi:4-hydroxy-2-oxoheptanedioate aldolase